MKHALSIAILVALLCIFQLAPVSASDKSIGFVQSVSGEAYIHRGGAKISADTGTQLHVGDTLSTGSDGSMGVVFSDESSASMGPNSNFVINKFEFSPNEGKFGVLIRITKGTFTYLTGLIGKLSPESARFETPTSTIGIRGTHFLINVEEPVTSQ
ncbi:MAG: FecR domain-containing protein [Syntrophorhabdaceae bacterium]|nr:FecR domain-containing protein [Syntrophorhabdaceae bacterium]